MSEGRFYKLEKKIPYAVQFEKVLRIANKINEGLKEPRSFGTDEILYASEIHIIDIIGRNPGINITEIAEKMGIRKSAIPKVIQKLTQKDMVARSAKQQNKKVVQMELTDKGKIAYNYHLEFHETLSKNIIKKFSAFTQEEMLFFNEIMSDIESCVDDILCEHKEC
jgi:DNA-binding MarR family transcriptional regulator